LCRYFLVLYHSSFIPLFILYDIIIIKAKRYGICASMMMLNIIAKTVSDWFVVESVVFWRSINWALLFDL
jgi:hypothetical protein